MMGRYLIVALLASAFAFADAATKEETLETLVQKTLPIPLQNVRPGVTARKSVEKRLGAPLQGSSDSEKYYQLSGKGKDSNDLTVAWDPKNKVRYFYYKLPSAPAQERYLLSSFRPHIPPEALREANAKLHRDFAQHDAGRTFDIAIPKKGLLLKFDLSSEDPTLRGVLSWKPGEKMP